MSSNETPTTQDENGKVVYTMTIRLRSGKVVRRPDGRPFRFVTRPKKR